MNLLCEDVQDIVYKYGHNLLYSDVMDELKDIIELEVIKSSFNTYPEYDTEIIHFNLSNRLDKSKLSIKIRQWTIQFDIKDNPVNSQHILDIINDRINKSFNITIKYRYSDNDESYIYF